MPQDDLARALASSPSPVMSPQDPIASPKPSPTISLSFFWSDPEDDGEDGDAEPAIDLRSPTGPHFDDGAHNLDGAHSIDGPIHAGGGARNLGRGRDGDGPFHAGGDYDSALQGGEMDVADQTHDIANAFNDGIDPDQEDGGIPNMASGSALSHQDDYDGEQADPDAQEEVDGEDQDDASVFGDQYLVHEFELTDAMFDYMDDADVEATLATPGSVEWVVDSDEEHGDSDDEAEPVASVDELFGVDSESFNPKVFHAGPDGFQVTAKIFANGLVIHPTTPDYPHSSDLNESTTKSRRGGIVNLVMAGAHDLTTEAVTSNIQYSLGSPMGDDKQFRVVKLFASIAHLIPGIEDMIVPAFRRHSRTCKGVKCCTYADTRISEMEHYGGYPDYTAEPYASIRASVEAAMRNSVYQITMTFYNSKVVDWLCACGHPGKLVHNANAPEHMSKWFVGCSAYNRLDPPGSHKGFGIRTAELDMGLLCDLMGYKGPHRPETSTTKPDVRCRTVVSNGRTSECPVGHVKSDGSVDRASVVSQNRDCTVKCDIYLPEDPEFRFYFIHMTGKHNHPPPPPLKTPRHLKVRINEGVKLRDAPNAFDHLTSLERLALVATIHKIDVAHPSLVQLDRVGEVTSRRTGPGIMASDEVAVFQAFASGSSTIRDFIRSVAIVDGQFLGFAMLDEGAHALSKSRVIDIDMTYRCIRGDINQVKVVAWDPIACRLIVVARAWVRGQDAQMYYTIVNTLDSAFNKIIGRRLQFSAIRRVREEIGAPIADLDLDVVELDAIRVDMDAGQAKGIGTWLREREPLLGDTWQEVVPHVLVLCHVHAARNIQQTGFSPDAKRKMTKLLEATSPGEWDTVLRQLRRMHEESPAATVPANKSLKDWVDKYAQPWVGGTMAPGLSKIPTPLLQGIRRNTNNIEGSNGRDNRVIGKGLGLLDYVERARKMDLDDFRRNRIAGDMGVTVRAGSSQAARDKKNEARASKRAHTRALKESEPTAALGRTRAATRASSSNSSSTKKSKSKRAASPTPPAPAPLAKRTRKATAATQLASAAAQPASMALSSAAKPAPAKKFKGKAKAAASQEQSLQLSNDCSAPSQRTTEELHAISAMGRDAIIAFNPSNEELETIIRFQQLAARDQLLSQLQ